MFAPATILVIEGPDKVGKQTQSNMLVAKLRKDNYKVKLVEVPVKSWITFSLIYWMLRRGYAKSWPNVFQTLQFLNKWFFQFKLLCFRWFYDYIVFDRWALSAIVYGDAGGANKTYNRFLYWFLRKPDVTMVLVGAARSGEVTDVYEKDNTLQAQVRRGYSEWYVAHAYDNNVALIDNMGTRDDVHARIMNTLDKFGVL